MHALVRICAVVLIGGGLLAVVLLGIPYTSSPRHLLTESRHREALQQWQEAIERYRDGQCQAVQAWMDRRCTLAEAMLWFEELDREYAQHWPPFRDMVRQGLPQSDEERHYLLIRERLQCIPHEKPEELIVARRRLEKEFHELLAARQNRLAAPCGAADKAAASLKPSQQSVGAFPSPNEIRR